MPTPGYWLVSNNVGTTSSTYDVGNDRLQFTLAANTNYSGVVFGEVKQSTLSSAGAQQVSAGQAAIHAHRYTAGTAASVTFATSDASNPGGLNWTSVLYRDNDCDGALTAADTLLTASVSVLAGQQVCVLNKVTSPAGATETYAPTPMVGAISHVLTNSDTTTVVRAGLTLKKELRKVTICPTDAATSLADTTAYTTSNSARPGELVEYRLSYRNDTDAPLTQVKLHDTVRRTRASSRRCVWRCQRQD